MRYPLYALIAASVVGCRPAVRSVAGGSGSDSAAIVNTFHALASAFEKTDDPESAADLYSAGHTQDAVLMFPGQPPVVGREAIRSAIRQIVASYRFSFPSLETKEVIVSGDWAIHRFTGVAEIQPRGGGPVTRESRKYMDVWHRDADGRWRIARHIFNAN